MPDFKRYTYNGITCQATRRRPSSRDDKKYMRDVSYDGKERLVHYGDPDMPMQRDNEERRENFLARHSCDTKKDPFAPGFWACYDWQNTSEKTMSDTIKALKAVGELEVLGIPYGSPTNKDADGEYFSASTRLHDDKYPTPPVVHYHGYDENGTPLGEPEYIGRVIGHEDKQDGRWYRVVLDMAKEKAQRVWEAAKQGVARASSGTATHLARRDADGHIREWPVIELSVFETNERMRPANQYAVALPILKAIYQIDPETPQDGVDKTLSTNNQKMEITMSDQENEKEVQAAPVDLTPILDAVKGIGETVKSLNTRIDAIENKPVNDPGVVQAAKSAAVHVADNTARYDNIPTNDLAFGIAILDEGKRSGRSRYGASETAVKALAKRMDSPETSRTEPGAAAVRAFKSAGLKANEINQSTLANYGDEWVGVFYSGDLWEAIRHEARILSMLPTMEVPQGAESVVIPLESTDPTWYNVAQAASLTSNPGGIPSNTVTASNLGTARQTMTLAKMGARVLWTGELEEDSVLPYVNQLRRQLAISGSEHLESALIDGDTDLTATTNINDIADTPSGTEWWTTVNGFRKLALVTNTANSRDAGTLTSGDFLETAKLMGVGGSNADVEKTGFIIPYAVHWKALELPDVKTRDVFSAATIENGRLTGLYGYPIMVSHHMHKAQPSRLTEATGKIDLNTASDNTVSAILAVRWDQWMFGWRRRMTLETTRFAAADSTEIVAMMRFGLTYRDTEASAISYNVTV